MINSISASCRKYLKVMCPCLCIALVSGAQVMAGSNDSEKSMPVFDYLTYSQYATLLPIEVTGSFAVMSRYIHPPVVEWGNVEGVAHYEVILYQNSKVLGVSKSQSSPCQAVNGWNKIKPGRAGVIIAGFDENGKRKALSRLYPFYVAPNFDKSAASKMKRPYKEAALKAFDAIYNFKQPRNHPPLPTSGPGSKIMPALLSICNFPRGTAGHSNPVLHNWIHVEMLIAMNKYADAGLKAKIQKYAKSVGDHLLMSRLSPNAGPYGGLVRGVVDLNGNPVLGIHGLSDELKVKYQDLVEPAKNGYAAEALVKIYELTGDRKYLDVAFELAEVLIKTQREDGSWPARVNGKTGELIADYSTSVISVASFFDRLNKHKADIRYASARDRAFNWILQYPVKNHGWVVNYDDGHSTATREAPYWGLSNWDTMAFIRYVATHPEAVQNPAAVIEDQFQWCDNTYVFYNTDMLLALDPYYPCVAEQSRPQSYHDGGDCWVPMDFHTANWATTLIAAYKLTGKIEYLEKAKAAANTLTQYQLDDGRTMTWMCDRNLGLSYNYCGSPENHNFWPAAWAHSAWAWSELVNLETK